MKLALDPAMLSGRPIQDVFPAAARAGYGCVELGNRGDFIPAFGPVRASTSELQGAAKAARAAGVEIASVAIIQAWSSPDEDLRSAAVAWWQAGIDAVLALGCRRINSELSGDPNRPAECRAAFLRSMDTIVPLLEREDLQLSVEPHPGDFLETTAEAVELVRTVGSPRLRYLHCVPHAYYLGGSVGDQVRQARGWFDHVHLADAFRPERTIVNPAGLPVRIHQHFDIGRGEIDWQETRDALGAVGFDGLLTVQVFGWSERAEESFKVNRIAAERLFSQEMQARTR